MLRMPARYNREWRYHVDLKLWFKRATQADTNTPGVTGNGSGSASNNTQTAAQAAAAAAGGVQYIYFDINAWERRLFAGGSIHGGGLNSGLLSEEEVRVKFAG
jgi:CCR4-NOT transcription complex subunit 2